LFKTDRLSDYQILEFTPSVLHKAIDLAERHGLRGYDAIQLGTVHEANAFAVSLDLSLIVLVSADVELNAAGVLEGLAVEDLAAVPSIADA
jgi:predicted nucleic acid-binding protein